MGIPACPDPAHAGSVRVRAGVYGRAGQRRQRWWCRPADGGAPHRFAEVLPRLVGPEQATCRECATELEEWEGQPTPRLYGFSVRHVAEALARVAAGESYRSVAGWVRRAAGRPLESVRRGRRLVDRNRHAQLVSDWVSVFAPVIWAGYAPTSWPARLVVDDDEFDNAGGQEVAAFSVLGAVGYPAGGRPMLWRVEAVPTATAAAWENFLAALPGTPELIVSDGAKAIAGGARMVWPEAGLSASSSPRLYRCEWHLLRGLLRPLTRALGEHGDSQPTHPLIRAARECLTSPPAWARLQTMLTEHAEQIPSLAAALRWAELNADLVQAQIAARDPRGPHSTGALEEAFQRLSGALAGRTTTMTNKHRADRLLMLLAADINGWVDEHRWAEFLRDHLRSRGGLASPQRTFL